MLVRLDPEGNETAALFDLAESFSGKHVLEIGCGDGRLTWLYADQAAHVTALDPDGDDIAVAIKSLPPRLRDRVEFWAGTIQEFETTTRFDLAILSWSL
jgi:2-polyprenyl-3-methyl-5-hydroxy-6-metoxy-1,4-benzoquinol methylase